MDAHDRFTGLAETYRRHRPSYPAELFEWIEGLFAPDRPRLAADVGCGTGISTRLLAARGLDVVGIDLNEDMLRAAREEGGARYERGAAAATGLADASVDLVCAAQAFHWFDVPATLGEFRRVLRPGGWCVAFWNLARPTPFQDEYRSLLARLSEDYRRLPRVAATLELLRGAEGIAQRRESAFANLQRFDEAGLLGRAHSASYVHVGVADLAGFDAELRLLFAKHERGGLVDFPYDCRAFAWRFDGRS